MKDGNLYPNKKEIQGRLAEQLFTHRDRLGLKQKEVAARLDIAESTYQRWESTGKGLSDIHAILKVFQVLEFSTTEIIDVLGLPPLTLSEAQAVCQDKDTMMNIKECGIYPYVRENRSYMTDYTVENLFFILYEEYLKLLRKRKNRHKSHSTTV